MKGAPPAAAAAMALIGFLFAANAAWADTCETFPGSQTYTDQCGPNAPAQGGAQAQPPQGGGAAVQSQPSNLRDVLRQSITNGSGTPQQNQAINAAEQRWMDAQARAQDATYRAQQTDDPAVKAQLKQQYDGAMRDLHQAAADLIRAGPRQRAQIEALLRDYDTQGAKAAAAAGFTSTSPPDVGTPPAPPAGPDNVAAAGSTVYVCDGAIAGANNVSCREITAAGQCTNVTMADGVVGWRDSIPVACTPGDLAQRQSFLDGHQDVAAAVRDAPAGFAMDAAGTDAERQRMTAETPEDALLAQLPPGCADAFKKYLADVGASHADSAEGQLSAAQAVDSYQALDASPECRDAIKRIADANTLDLPVRHLRARTRNAFATALAADPSRSLPRAPAAELQDDGYDPAEVLQFGMALLNLAGGAANLANAMHGGGGFRPGVPSGAVRTYAPAPRGGGGTARYPAPAPTHTPNCTMDANNWLTCK